MAVSAGYPLCKRGGNVTVGPTVKRLANQSNVWGKSIREREGWLGLIPFPSFSLRPRPSKRRALVMLRACSITVRPPFWPGLGAGWQSAIWSSNQPTNTSHCRVSLSDSNRFDPFFVLYSPSPTSSRHLVPFSMPIATTIASESLCVDLPHQCLIVSGLGARHSVTQSIINSQTGLRLRAHPASLPAANSPFLLPDLPDPSHAPDRSSIAISVSRFRYCRSWVICLMPSGPPWSRQSVYATWLETSSRTWTAHQLRTP